MKLKLVYVLWLIPIVSLWAQPTITSFSPTSAKSGDVVTISGSGFNTTINNNIVFFGATKATVNTATATTLTVTVPLGATYEPIKVLNTSTNLYGVSIRSFHPIYSPNKPTITTIDFRTEQGFDVGTQPFGMAIADLDGDGKIDIVTANVGGNNISVLKNTATYGYIDNTSFATTANFATGNNPNDVAIADFDGDGKPDIAAINHNSNTVSIFKNTTTLGVINASSFAAKIDFTTGSRPYAMTAGDLDGDGKIDLAIVNSNSNTVSVLRNTSTTGVINSSSFATKVDYAVGTIPYGVAVADIDGDRKLEILAANRTSGSLSILRNTSTAGIINSGSFAAKVDFATGSGSNSIAVGDVDGDTKLDIAVLNYGAFTYSVFRNTATLGTINASSLAAKVDYTTGNAPFAISMSDMDGDGKVDILFSNHVENSVSVARNNCTVGTINFAARVNFSSGTAPTEAPRYVPVGDIDGDTRPDLIVSNYSTNSVSVLRNADLINVTSSFSAFSACIGTASAQQSFTVGGTFMTTDIVVTAPTNFEISTTNGSGYTNSITLPRVGSTVSTTTIYVRMASSATVTFVDTIRCSGTGAVTRKLIVNGTVNPLPTITLGTINNVTNSATTFSIPYTATTGTPNRYSISAGTPTPMPSFTAINNATFTSSPINVTIPASAANTYNFNLTVRNNTTTCESTVYPITLTVIGSTITTTGTLSAFSSCSGTASAQQTFSVSGNNLTANLMVTPPTGFEISTTSGSGFTNNLSFVPTGGTVTTRTIYVRMAATATGTPTGNITCASTGATTQNVAASGTVNALPTITLGTVANVLISATNFSLPYTATTGSPNRYSITTGTPTPMPSFTAVTNATLAASPITVTILASAANTYNFNVTVNNSTTGCISSVVPFTVTVDALTPTITTIGTLSAFSSCNGTASPQQTFSVSGNNLTANLIVTPPTGFEISTTSGTGFTNSISLTPTAGTIAATTIFVRLTSTATGNPTGNITCASTGATTQNVAVSGTVKTNTTSTTNISVCPSAMPYLWNGINRTTAGTYTFTTTNAQGCDSVATLNLTVRSNSTSTTNISVCPSAMPFLWNGINRTTAGTYTFTTTNSQGCDSVATLNLTVRSNSTSTTNISVCPSALPYLWNGINRTTTAGTYTFTTTNAQGCDSVATLNLTVRSNSTSTTNISVCPTAMPYLWNGINRTTAGTYTFTTTNAQGCDSVATLNLTVRSNSTSTTNISVCPSAMPYLWNGINRTTAGTYTFTTTNSQGCDSVATLNLTVFPATPLPSNIGNSYTALTLSGFNVDIVANGSVAVTSSTTSDFGGGFYLYDNTFSTNGNLNNIHLPIGGSFTSAVTSGLPFRLASYTSNNSLKLSTTGLQNGVLNVNTTAVQAKTVFILGASGNSTNVFLGNVAYGFNF